MKTKVIKFFSLLILFCLFQSCISQKTEFGKKTEIHGSKDSARSIAKISFIKSLDDSEFEEGQFSNGKESLKYRMLSPEKIKLERKYPLIVVFHGSGAVGTDNKSQMGILSKMWLLPENRKKYPSFVLSPQFPVRSSNYHLDEKRRVSASESNEYLDLLLKSIDSLANSKNIDRSRIYVMGFSMGGATVSNAISKRPDLFAAAINISGISQFDNNEKLLKTPIWLVHGSLDTDNFPQSNLKFYEEMKDKGQVLFWEFKDKYHNNILSAKLADAMPQWLFNQKK
ncbi:prolyl oligopeptidase family serine peptidase [Chryseobacterium sp. MDT2-18]|uniref:carboxylesterase family protein n=1 Tax=Chryseobacterium sp. MDT2-18 TaxID=1259136 RepID=UPI00277F8C8D|nr:prolyl oligopeptidase family serine peptidase [Chryseobacterium sp. MDT2-18]MDQ0476661.1 putative peptidase [Chryseobacterium sp. MDT2-18]